MKGLEEDAREMLKEAGVQENPRTLVVAREMVLMKMRLESRGRDWNEVKTHLFAKIRELQAKQDIIEADEKKTTWN